MGENENVTWENNIWKANVFLNGSSILLKKFSANRISIVTRSFMHFNQNILNSLSKFGLSVFISYDVFPLQSKFHFMNVCFFFLAQNKCAYMLPNLIYSVIKTASICIGFIAHTIATVFALGLIDSIQEHTIPGKLANIGDGMIQTKANSPELDETILSIKRSLAGMMLLHWFISAICTGLF